MSKIYIVLLLMAVKFLFSRNVVFGDTDLKKAIISAYPAVDANRDNEISYEEARTLTVIRNLASYPQITDAGGIEAFTNLTELDLKQKNLTGINLLPLTKLTTLNLRENQIAGTLDLSTLKELRNLELNKNKISSLILPESGKIEILYCNENNLSEINVSSQPGLQRLFLVSNQLSALDISRNPLLERLHADNNKIAGLNLEGLSLLSWMSVNNNLLANINFKNNPALRTILAQNNQLRQLNFQDGSSNNLTLINLTGNAAYSLILKDCNDIVPKDTTVTVQDNCSTLSVGSEAETIIAIYPNPVGDFITISGIPNIDKAVLYDMSGRQTVLIFSGNRANVSALPKGVYILRFNSRHGNFSGKFIKK